MAACSHVNFAAPRATPWHVALTGATAGADAVQAACIIYVYNIHNGSSRTPGKQRGGRGVISSSRDDSYYAYTRATAAGLQSHLVHLQSRSVLHALALRGRKSRSSPNNWLMDIGIAALIADRRPPAARPRGRDVADVPADRCTIMQPAKEVYSHFLLKSFLLKKHSACRGWSLHAPVARNVCSAAPPRQG
jgi:hypothetical protein